MRIASSDSSQIDSSVEVQKQAKLVDTAQQFEGMLLQEMLKPMRGGKDSWGGDDSADSDSASDSIKSFGTEALAKAISKGGGFGIAKQVIAQVKLEHQRGTEKEDTRVLKFVGFQPIHSSRQEAHHELLKRNRQHAADDKSD